MKTTTPSAHFTAELLRAMQASPEGGSIYLDSLKAPRINHYAVGGYVQNSDSFNAMFYTIADNPAELVSPLNDLSEQLAPRIEASWSKIVGTANAVGWWWDSGEFFVDVVDIIPCGHGNEEQLSVFVSTGLIRAVAMSDGIRNGQDAIGHVCNTVQGGYENVTL